VNYVVLVILIAVSFSVLVGSQEVFADVPPFSFKFGSFCDISTTSGCVDPDGVGPLVLGDGQFNSLFGVDADSSGNIYVADRQNHRIQKFDSNGNFLLKWGSLGTNDGQFDHPFGLVVDSSDNVYVTDQFNNRVQKFDSNGNFLMKFGSHCRLFDLLDCVDPDGIGLLELGDGQFDNVKGLIIDLFGNLYIVDLNNHRIQKFDSNGNFLLKWGSFCFQPFAIPGPTCVDPDGLGPLAIGDGQFNNPDTVAVDGSGNIYVGDGGGRRIQKFDSNGNFLLKWGSGALLPPNGFNSPLAVTADSLNNVYVFDRSDRIRTFDSNGNLLSSFGSLGSGDGQFNEFAYLTFKGSSILYVGDTGNNRVQVFGEFIPEVQVIGGEIIPIEQTSLLVAGAQTFSWMIPVVLSVLGIGLFVASRKKEC